MCGSVFMLFPWAVSESRLSVCLSPSPPPLAVSGFTSLSCSLSFPLSRGALLNFCESFLLCVCVWGPLLHSSLSGVCRVSLCVLHRVCLCVSRAYPPVGHVSPRPGLGWLPPTATLADTSSVCPSILPQQRVLALSKICLSVCPVSSFPPPPLILTHSLGELTPCSQCWHLPAFRAGLRPSGSYKI